MKWSIQQLNKLTVKPYSFTLEFDFTEEIKDVDDILAIAKVLVTGVITKVKEEMFQIKYHIKAPLVMPCALTLEPVEYLFDEDYDEIFTTILSDECFLIEKNSLDFKEVVWSDIIIDKPLTVKHPNAYQILEERGIKLGETPELDEDEEIYYDSQDDDSDDSNSNKD